MDHHQKPAVIKAKNKLLKLLPRAAQAVSVSFQNPPYSPAKEKRSDYTHTTKNSKTHIGKNFSGTLVPAEARRTSKNSSFATHEPTSPKVSCMGTIKCKHMQNKKMIPVLSKEDKRKLAAATANAAAAVAKTVQVPAALPAVKEKKKSAIKSLFHHGRKSDASNDRRGSKTPSLLPEKAPGLGQLKRFSSGRDSLANFDWMNPTAQVAPEYYSDEERESRGDADVEKREVIISFSAPILTNGVGNNKSKKTENGAIELEPRKEINLWKRRTMAQPKPLVI